ncbi:hypothetical protein SAMN05421688_2042 [Poseidonocella pacifica]|uniref:AAA+ family ATPase n=1 Tax=Poseidonocella pacifica TaxID=871651 RepID=A0A1I0XB36_9RHOB|nr:hypothetical protein [Poseidonocella pacifica]SFA97887.1 hypothetical protein SAMN05421688_2042 [Poseidonocella pacifica]
MKHVALMLCLMCGPVHAQDAPGDMRRGAELFFDGLRDQFGPALDGLRGFAEDITPEMRELLRDMGPGLRALAEKIGDLSDYHPPEKLPNGDIILRRKVPEAPPLMPPDGEIDI